MQNLLIIRRTLVHLGNKLAQFVVLLLIGIGIHPLVYESVNAVGNGVCRGNERICHRIYHLLGQGLCTGCHRDIGHESQQQRRNAY